MTLLARLVAWLEMRRDRRVLLGDTLIDAIGAMARRHT
jgi:hypothetical protein